MIRFLTHILDIKNLLGMQRSTSLSVLTFHVISNVVTLNSLSCNGEIQIKYTAGGTEQTDTYSDLNMATVSISPDANTDVTITGNVTALHMLDGNSINTIDTRQCISLEDLVIHDEQITDIDISQNVNLTNAQTDSCNNLVNITIGSLPNLQILVLSYNPQLASIDTTGCPIIRYIEAVSCPALMTVRCRATTYLASESIANLVIQPNAANAGTVYCNPDDTYYDVTIKPAADNYGWSILPL